jgi:hypothetical protein
MADEVAARAGDVLIDELHLLFLPWGRASGVQGFG